MDQFQNTLLSFSKQRYYELLELEISNQLDEKTKETLECYEEVACAQINWEMKGKYRQVLKSYYLGKLDESDLWIKLDKISKSASELQKMMRQYSFVISPHLKCLELHIKIHDLIIDCEQYTEEWGDADFKEELEDLKPYFEKFKNQLITDSKDIIRLILEN